MAKHLKLTIKNTQIAEAINLGKIKDKLAKKKELTEKEPEAASKQTPEKTKAKKKIPPVAQEEEAKVVKEEAQPRIRARSKSVFAENASKAPEKVPEAAAPEETVVKPVKKPSDELRRKVFGDEAISQPTPEPQSLEKLLAPKIEEVREQTPVKETPVAIEPKAPRLGPTGRHVKDLLPQKPAQPQAPAPVASTTEKKTEEDKSKIKPRTRPEITPPAPTEETAEAPRKGGKFAIKEFRDVKPAKRQPEEMRTFDARDRQGLRDSDEEQRWRKKRGKPRPVYEEQAIVRPTHLKIRTPISIKDLAVEMKLKAAQLISKLFLQGVIVTLNDMLDDETTIQLLGQEFGCEITIDTSEEQRIRITDKTLKQEIKETDPNQLSFRPPVVAFMGHVDHGKTSLIDAIRKSNRAAGEAGAITQHIGAFRCHTAVGDITILDTPGHEAFSAMRARGADVTDIVVLVVAGDEGIRQQTLEAIQHAKSASVTIVVAINKSDKPGFNPENVYRQLADHDLLPEVWGGQVLTVNCSALTGAGIKELLETLALQAEIMELRANPDTRARGSVLESEMHKGLGSVATVLVQNGTLEVGNALVFGQHWGRVKTMRDEFGKDVLKATPSTPVAITGFSGLPEAGQEFIVVKNEREAREIGEARLLGIRQLAMQQKKTVTVESLLQQATPTTKKILNLILRADVQGSLEALRTALLKIESQKAEVNILFAGVGEISESDIQLAATSKAVIIGFHTKVESHADTLIKQLGIQVRLHDIIYHAIDDVKAIMTKMLDMIAQETYRGKAEVKALFKSSHTGMIAGCMVTDGTINRNYHIKVMREGNEIGKSTIDSLRRVKDDVREVSKGFECGIVLAKSLDVAVGDILEAFEVTYIAQEL